jgi:tRNA threonylcarbamoyladenosine biosynthesis protein TsaE
MPPCPQPLEQPLAVQGLAPEHASILESRRLRWRHEPDCAAFAAALAARPALRDATIELCGELGAGKTSFVRHLLRALGVSGPVRSPSFAVMEPYRVGDRVVSHFDFYRFGDPHEWADAGFRDVFAAPGLKLAEWPERAAAMLPPPDLRLTIAFDPDAGDDAREVTAEAFSARGQALLA